MGSDDAPGGFGGSTIEGAVLGTERGEEVGSVSCISTSGPLVDPMVVAVRIPYAQYPQARPTQAPLVTPARPRSVRLGTTTHFRQAATTEPMVAMYSVTE